MNHKTSEVVPHMVQSRILHCQGGHLTNAPLRFERRGGGDEEEW